MKLSEMATVGNGSCACTRPTAFEGSRGVVRCSLGWLALAALIFGCQSLDEGAYSYADCVGEGACDPAADTRPEQWRCLPPSMPEPPTFPDQLPGVAYIVPIVDFANPPTPPGNLTISVCQILDTECERPLTPPNCVMPACVPPPTNPDPARPYIFQVSLPFGFTGFLKMEAMGYLTTEYYFGGPMRGNPAGGDMPQVIIGQEIPMVRDSVVEGFYTQLNVEPVPRTGLLALRTLDCNGARAEGVRVEMLNEEATGWTLISDLPQSDDQSIPTDERGVTGFANIPPRGVVVEGIAPMGDRYGQAGFVVKENQLTIGEIRFDQATYGK